MIVTLKHKRKDPWSGVYKYKNCYDYISAYMTRSGNRHTGLTSEDESRLEKALGMTSGTLSVNSPFWITFAVKITNKELVLNTDNALNELQYIFLKNHKGVANGVNDTKQKADWILIDKEFEAQQTNKISRRKREAIREFDKMSMEDMRKCLRIFGYKSDSMSNEVVESKMNEIIEREADRFFAKWVENSHKNTEYMIEMAISKNIMRKNKNMYYYGTEVIGTSLDDTVVYLEDKKNQDLRLSISSELEGK